MYMYVCLSPGERSLYIRCWGEKGNEKNQWQMTGKILAFVQGSRPSDLLEMGTDTPGLLGVAQT